MGFLVSMRKKKWKNSQFGFLAFLLLGCATPSLTLPPLVLEPKFLQENETSPVDVHTKADANADADVNANAKAKANADADAKAKANADADAKANVNANADVNGKSWELAWKKAHFFFQRGQKNLDQATPIFYSLIPEKNNLIFPIEQAFLQRRIITIALQEKTFSQYVLQEDQAQKISKAWELLSRALQDFLYAQWIVSQIRGEWKWWYKFPYLVEDSIFPPIGEKVQSLPTLEEIDLQCKEVEILTCICRELLKKNAAIVPQ
jgi:hypothetical protein